MCCWRAIASVRALTSASGSSSGGTGREGAVSICVGVWSSFGRFCFDGEALFGPAGREGCSGIGLGLLGGAMPVLQEEIYSRGDGTVAFAMWSLRSVGRIIAGEEDSWAALMLGLVGGLGTAFESRAVIRSVLAAVVSLTL